MKKVLLIVIGVGAALPLMLYLGVSSFMTATATRIHPDPQAISSVTLSAPSPRWAHAVEQARERVRAAVAEQNLPGLSVAVGVGGDLVWAEGFGWADLGSHELDFTGQLALDRVQQATDKRVGVSPSTRFRIVGVSLALTSGAVGLLLEKGRLKLDDEIRTHVPAFPKKQWPVTLRQLMAHQAGIANDAGDEAPLMTRCDRTIDGLKLEGFAERRLRFEPGTRLHYSTYGWVLVSAAVEAVANESFFSFMRSQIFEPLGLRDTVPESWAEPIPDRATFYFPRFSADPRYGPDLVGRGDHSCFAGAGAYLSTPSDLVRFGMAIDGGALLRPATITMLQTPQRLASGAETGTGLGWDLESVALAGQPARMASQHDDRSAGGSSALITFPGRGLVVAVTTNITFVDAKAMALNIAQLFAERR